MKGDGTAIEQVPRLTVGVDCPSTDQSRIAEVQPALAGPTYLSVGLGDEHRLALMDGDLRRADLNFERHRRRPFLMLLGSRSRRNGAHDRHRRRADIRVTAPRRTPAVSSHGVFTLAVRIGYACCCGGKIAPL